MGYIINMFEFAFPTGTQGFHDSRHLHVEDHLADPAKVYLDPDAVADGDEGTARADVFSRGAIAYHILTGRPPVTNPFDLPSRLREGNGLFYSPVQ